MRYFKSWKDVDVKLTVHGPLSLRLPWKMPILGRSLNRNHHHGRFFPRFPGARSTFDASSSPITPHQGDLHTKGTPIPGGAIGQLFTPKNKTRDKTLFKNYKI